MPDGSQRIYATQQASVVSYFEDDGDGGTLLVVHPGEYACPYSTTAEKLEAVRLSVLEETARRLNCPPDKVHYRSLSELVLVADPVLAEMPRWSSKRLRRQPCR